MNINTNSLVLFFIKLFKIFAVVYVLNTILFFYLPKVGVNNEIYKDDNLSFYQINISSAFEEKNKPKKQVVTSRDIQQINKFLLTAIYSVDNQNDGWIIISTKGSESNTTILSVNEKYKGYTLKEIHSQKAIFEKSSKEYEVYLDKESKLNEILKMPKEEIDYSKPLEVSKKDIKKYVSDFDAIWKSIAIKEVLDKKGNIDGFKVLSITKNSPFDKLGLKKGDIIKKVNNIVLKSYSDAFNIYNQIDRVDNLQITVQRNYTQLEINYEID